MTKKLITEKRIKELPINRYMNVKYDFSFKYIFGNEANKHLLIDLLNTIFKGRKVITDLIYNNPIHKGMRKADRKTAFDVYCTGSKGEKFIVEVQQCSQRFFKDRIIFYAAKLINEQGISVTPKWDYKLPEIYVVAIMDFCFDKKHPDCYLHDVRLMDINTNTPFYNKLSYIFVELPKFKKTADELKTKEEEWLFSIKNMENLPEIPVSLAKKQIFKDLYHQSEVVNLNPKDMNAYQQNLKIKRDIYAVEKFAIETAEMRGARRERAKAGKDKKELLAKVEREKEGLLAKVEREKEEMALKLKVKGMPLDEIADLTSLSITQIASL